MIREQLEQAGIGPWPPWLPGGVGHPYAGAAWVYGMSESEMRGGPEVRGGSAFASPAEAMARAILRHRDIDSAIPSCDWEALCVWLDGPASAPLPSGLYWTPDPPQESRAPAIVTLDATACSRWMSYGIYRVGWSVWPHILLPACDLRGNIYPRHASAGQYEAPRRPNPLEQPAWNHTWARWGSGQTPLALVLLAHTDAAVGCYEGGRIAGPRHREQPLQLTDLRALWRLCRLRVLRRLAPTYPGD